MRIIFTENYEEWKTDAHKVQFVRGLDQDDQDRTQERTLTMSNQCPWCKTVFARIPPVRRHVTMREQKARCPVNAVQSHFEVITPRGIACPVYKWHADTLDDVHTRARDFWKSGKCEKLINT